jgi:hypothetical protein
MPNHRHSTTNSFLSSTDAKVTSDTRRVIQESRKLLQEGPPDTFLGREIHTPLPTQEDEEAANGHAPSTCAVSHEH